MSTEPTVLCSLSLCPCKCQNDLLEAAPFHFEKARIMGIASEHASDYLHALPISSLGLKLADSELRVICATRLGSPLCHQHTCSCGVEVDPMGRHGLSCKNQVGRIPRHSHINDLVKRALSTAEFPSRLEPQGLSRNSSLRPDGLTLHPYKEGKCMLWDVTVVDTLATLPDRLYHTPDFQKNVLCFLTTFQIR